MRTNSPDRQGRRPHGLIVAVLERSPRLRQLLSSRMTRHSAINVAGSIVPIALAIPCLAILPRHLSTEAFSLLLLAWALVGYAGILDLGLSRAVTMLIARTAADSEARREVLATSFWVAVASGLAGAAIIWLGASSFLDAVLKVSPALRADALIGFRLIALSIPLLLPYLIFQGYWDGRERFIEANLQRVVGGTLPIVAATLAVLAVPTFTAAAVGIVAGRGITLIVSLARGHVWRDVGCSHVSRAQLRQLLGFGGWVTVSSAVSPLMGYLDRYILAYARGAAVVAFYAAPSELVLKLLVLPIAVTRSLYPKLAAAGAAGDSRGDLRHAYMLIAAVCLPIAAGLALLAPWILTIWLGPSYAANSTNVVRLLALGFVFSGLAQIPFTHLLAKGRPELIAAVHLVEIAVFVPTAYLAADRYGPVGSAGAWAARNLIDLAIFYFVGKRAAWR